MAVDVINTMVAERAIPIIRGIEKFQHAGHHPAGTPLGHRLAVEVKGVGEIGLGIIGVHGEGRFGPEHYTSKLLSFG